MITKLQSLIFGLGEYKKVKIEERYNEVKEILLDISIDSALEFEILESCIFKIKEQLRIKSSNLNTIITKNTKYSKKNSSGFRHLLTKKKIQEILDTLQELKHAIITFAFQSGTYSISSNSISNTSNTSNITTTLSSSATTTPTTIDENDYYTISNYSENDSRDETNESSYKISEEPYYTISPLPQMTNPTNMSEEEKIEKRVEQNEIEEEKIEEEKIEEKEEKREKEELQILDNFENISTQGKVSLFYTMVQNFDTDLPKQKKLSIQLFETKLYISTLIFTEKSVVYTFGITQHELSQGVEKLSPLLQSRNKELSLQIEEVYSKIMAIRYKNNDNYNNNENYEDEIKDERKNSNEVSIEDNTSIHNEYVELKEPTLEQITTKKSQEDSLEELINGQEDTHKNIFVTHQEEDNSISVIEGDDSIIVEREDTICDNNEDGENNISTYTEEIPESLENLEEQHHNEVEKVVPDVQIPSSPYTIFSDEVVSLTLNQNGIHKSQSIITFSNLKPLIENDPQTIAYSALFSKAVLQSIFQLSSSQGTMSVASLHSNSIDLIPRFINDVVFQFGSEPQSEEVLTQIQQKILQTMAKALSKNKGENPIVNENNNNSNNISSQSTEHEENQASKRAKVLLSSLRRLA